MLVAITRLSELLQEQGIRPVAVLPAEESFEMVITYPSFGVARHGGSTVVGGSTDSAFSERWCPGGHSLGVSKGLDAAGVRIEALS